MNVKDGEKIIIAKELAHAAYKALDQSIYKLGQLGLSEQNRKELDDIAAALERAAKWIYDFGAPQ